MNRRALAVGLVIEAAAVLVIVTAFRGSRAEVPAAAACFDSSQQQPSPVAQSPAGAPVRRDVSAGFNMALDSIGGKATSPHATASIPFSTLLTATGWAVDTGRHLGVAMLLVRVDDGPAVRADTCGDRPDVAGALGDRGYKRSGWSARLEFSRPGQHTIHVDTVSTDGATVQRDAAVTRVDLVADRSHPVRLDGVIDNLGGIPLSDAAHHGSAFTQHRGGDIRFTGWVADLSGAAALPVRGIDVLVDGKPQIEAAYGNERADTANALHSPATANDGYSVRFPSDDLPLGRHTIVLRAHLFDGRSGMIPAHIVLDIVPPG